MEKFGIESKPENNEAEFLSRIEYQGDLKPMLEGVASDYGLGEFKGFQLITTGYEDLNLTLETESGRYFVKIFSSFRKPEDCERYVKVVEEAIDAGVNTSVLLKSNQGHLHRVEDLNINLAVMEYIEGNNFYDLGQELTEEEAKEVIRQATLINSLDYKPDFVYDSWAITSMEQEYEKAEPYFSEADKQVVSPLLESFKQTDIDSLPHSLVHGDIIATNLMKATDGQIKVVDFAVSNYYPRIMELAVLKCNLLHNFDYDFVASEYRKHIELTEEEQRLLPLFINFAHAMHIIGATRENGVSGNVSEENTYWLEQGRRGLGLS